jgi:hypothetical protein
LACSSNSPSQHGSSDGPPAMRQLRSSCSAARTTGTPNSIRPETTARERATASLVQALIAKSA